MTTTRISKRATTIAAPALAAILILSGCGISSPDEVITPMDTSESANQSESAATPEEAGTTTAPESDDDYYGDDDANDSAASSTQSKVSIDPVEAGKIAMEAHKGSRVVDLELDREKGITVWEVKVVTQDAKFEVDVDAVTGEIVKDKEEDTDDLAEYNSRLDAATLTYADAIEVIRAEHKGATVVELDLDEDDGVILWEAEAVTGDHVKYELEIHADSGKTLKNERED